MAAHVRLFRNRPEVRWQYRVHEQILPAVRRSGGEVRKANVGHSRYNLLASDVALASEDVNSRFGQKW